MDFPGVGPGIFARTKNSGFQGGPSEAFGRWLLGPEIPATDVDRGIKRSKFAFGILDFCPLGAGLLSEPVLPRVLPYWPRGECSASSVQGVPVAAGAKDPLAGTLVRCISTSRRRATDEP